MRYGLLAALLLLTGCAPGKFKRIGDVKINGARIITAVGPRSALPRVCKRPGEKLNGCSYRKTSRSGKTVKTCWNFLADDAEGAKAAIHEFAHCGGADESEARCADWPGTKAPAGQKCKERP